MTDLSSYLDAFAPGGGTLADWRRHALDRFGEIGLPGRREEEWRFTSLAPLEKEAFPPAPPTEISRIEPDVLAPFTLSGAGARLVLVNGRINPAQSRLAPWLNSTAFELDRLAGEIDLGETEGRQPFAALNAAYFADGFALIVPPGTVIEQPIEIIHWNSARAPVSFHTRNLLLLGAGSRASLIETHAGTGHYWSNSVTRIELGEGARLDHIRLQEEPEEAIHTAMTRGRLGRAARYEGFLLTLGARLSRHDLHLMLAGEAAQCTIGGTWLLRGQQEATTATLIDHAAPGGTTREILKGVVDDRAHGVFQGKIAVRPEAQKTDAHQLNPNLVLGPRAAVDTKPELEILADDVKCSHGATVGDLDEAAMFYLRARGIDEAAARRMLIDAFAGAALDLVADPEARNHLRRRLDRWLGNGKA